LWLRVPFEKPVFAFFPPDDHLEVRRRTQVPAHLEQHDVIQLIIAAGSMLPHIDQLVGIILVSQKTAAAGRLGIIAESEFGCQRHLRFA